MLNNHEWVHEQLARGYLDDLLQGNRAAASQRIMRAVDQGVSLQDLYLEVFQWTLHEVGRLWESNQASVAQEHVVTASTQLIMSQLYPRIFSTARNGRNLLGLCVEGDLHEVGLRMVCDFFEMEGWDTLFLGANTIEDGLIEMIRERRPDVVAISATIKAHVGSVKQIVARIRQEKLPCKILVGGRPFQFEQDLWKEVGADGVAGNALEAVEVGKRLVS